MGKVLLGATVSVDGFIADPNDQVGPLFDWYTSGTVATCYGDEYRTLRTDAASATDIERKAANVAACVIGRRLFELMYAVRRDLPFVIRSNAELQASVDRSPDPNNTRS